MTAHNQPHKYRCETCSNTYKDDLQGFTYCKETHLVLFVRDGNDKIIDRGVSVLITRCVGCASHSDATKAEQRIADVIAELEKRKRDAEREGATLLVSYINIDEILALLRGKEE